MLHLAARARLRVLTAQACNANSAAEVYRLKCTHITQMLHVRQGHDSGVPSLPHSLVRHANVTGTAQNASVFVSNSSPADSRVVIDVFGCVSTHIASTLRDHVASVIARKPRHIELNLTRVFAVDDGGWRELAAIVEMIAQRTRD